MAIKHNEPVQCAKFSPCGNMIVTCSVKTATLWQVKDYSLCTALNHDDWISRTLQFSPNGKVLATIADDTIHLWDTKTGKLISKLNPAQGIISDISISFISISFSPDSKLIATTAQDLIKFWQTKDGLCNATINTINHDRYVDKVLFTPKGNHYIITKSDSPAHVYDIKTNKLIATLEHKSLDGSDYSDYDDVSFSSNGLIAQTSSPHSGDNKVTLWNTQDYCYLGTINLIKVIRAIRFNSDGTQLTTTSGPMMGNTVTTVWDLTKLLHFRALLKYLSLPQAVILDCIYKTTTSDGEQFAIENHLHLQNDYKVLENIEAFLPLSKKLKKK